MNEEKLLRFIIKLIDMTGRGEIEWDILNGDPDCEPVKMPLKAKLAGYAYEASIDSNSFVLFRCRRPIFEDGLNPIGWDDYLTYYLTIYDVNNVFRNEISKSVQHALEDLYEEVQNQIHPADEIIDRVLSKH